MTKTLKYALIGVLIVAALEALAGMWLSRYAPAPVVDPRVVITHQQRVDTVRVVDSVASIYWRERAAPVTPAPRVDTVRVRGDTLVIADTAYVVATPVRVEWIKRDSLLTWSGARITQLEAQQHLADVTIAGIPAIERTYTRELDALNEDTRERLAATTTRERKRGVIAGVVIDEGLRLLWGALRNR